MKLTERVGRSSYTKSIAIKLYFYCESYEDEVKVSALCSNI